MWSASSRGKETRDSRRGSLLHLLDRGPSVELKGRALLRVLWLQKPSKLCQSSYRGDVVHENVQLGQWKKVGVFAGIAEQPCSCCGSLNRSEGGRNAQELLPRGLTFWWKTVSMVSACLFLTNVFQSTWPQHGWGQPLFEVMWSFSWLRYLSLKVSDHPLNVRNIGPSHH